MSFRMKSTHKVRWLIFLALLLAGCASSQDVSKSYSRAVINQGEIVPAESVRVHEYLNYYEQRFPEPGDQPLGLDLRLGNTHIPTSGGEVWLQIGLQAQSLGMGERTPLNLALVLDCSGSMNGDRKMESLKQSLELFLLSLQPEDMVSIVGYDDRAFVLRNAQPVGNGRWVRNIVNSLSPGGSTNLHAGLMRGFEEVWKNFDIRRNNRVILLTDGIANVGVTNPDRIAADALEYNRKGIYLSTIGLGMDMNDELLNTLADQGHGAYHFIDSAQEMDKVFRKEVDGLVERVANDVRVNIQPAHGVQLTSVTGYEGTPPQNGVQVVLYDMGAGESQVLIVRLHVSPCRSGEQELVEVTLQYSDVFAQKPRQVSNWVSTQAITVDRYNPLVDIEVRRNAAIVRMAEALKEIDALCDAGRYEQAWDIAFEMEYELRAVAALAGDPQMVEDADLFSRYQMTLENVLGYDPMEADFDYDTISSQEQDQRWGDAENSTLPTIDVD
jgi:Ca-activated chloride channel family protein